MKLSKMAGDAIDAMSLCDKAKALIFPNERASHAVPKKHSAIGLKFPTSEQHSHDRATYGPADRRPVPARYLTFRNLLFCAWNIEFINDGLMPV